MVGLFGLLVLVLTRTDGGSGGDDPEATATTRRTGPVTWHVAADANGGGDGSSAEPFDSIADGVSRAQPGDTVAVGPGRYREIVASARHGRPDAPIKIIGTKAAIEGGGGERLVRIEHDHIVFSGFEVSQARNLVWIVGVTGVRILDNVLHDAGGECLRMRYFSQDNEVARNHIRDCGQEGFDVTEHRKNGEGIYVGTAPEQLDRNPTNDPDASDRNWIHDNVIQTPAECIDIKEGASDNRIEHNTCTAGEDPDSGGLSSRGRGTVFVGNTSTGHVGAGIRLGGDTDDDGTGSIVRDNILSGNEGFGLKVLRLPQGLICGNSVTDNEAGATTNPALRPAAPCPVQ